MSMVFPIDKGAVTAYIKDLKVLLEIGSTHFGTLLANHSIHHVIMSIRSGEVMD